jgi:fluoroacetyl-CoA thioesterase
MTNSLKAGMEHEFKFTIPGSKTVPNLYLESPEFQKMPEVFATGFMIGLIEWACIQAINPHINWPAEQTVGTHVNLSHTAPTPPGLEVTVKVKLMEAEGRRLLFNVEMHDEIDEICRGTHERFIINADKFNLKIQKKLKSISGK